MAHSAGPDAGVATVAVDLWNWISAYAERFNQGRDKTFDQLLPSLRVVNTSTDAAMYDHVKAQIGIRLPWTLTPTPLSPNLSSGRVNALLPNPQ
jgi:LysW-gamma-L-lysine carboxypeptidase